VGQDVEQWIRDLKEAGWHPWNDNPTVWLAPCGHLFRGPYRAWVEMNGTHLADCIAAGAASQLGADHG